MWKIQIPHTEVIFFEIQKFSFFQKLTFPRGVVSTRQWSRIIFSWRYFRSSKPGGISSVVGFLNIIQTGWRIVCGKQVWWHIISRCWSGLIFLGASLVANHQLLKLLKQVWWHIISCKIEDVEASLVAHH